MVEINRNQNKKSLGVGKWLLLFFFVLVAFLPPSQPIFAFHFAPSSQTEAFASVEQAEDEWLYIDHISLTDAISGLAVPDASPATLSAIRKIYYHLLNNKINLFTGNYSISFETLLSSAELSAIYAGSNVSLRQKMLIRAIQTVFTALRFDDPSFYFLDFQKIGINFSAIGANVISLSLTPYVSQIPYLIRGMGTGSGNVSPQSAQTQIENKANQILAVMPDFAYDYQKVTYLHDALIDMNVYDYSVNLDDDNLNFPFIHTMYGSLIENKSVCDGYSYALKYLLNQAGIPAIVVSGDTRSGNGWAGHMWNYVKLGNHWYAIDSTWDDTGAGRHEYLMVGQTMKNGISQFYSDRREKTILFQENTFAVNVPPLAANSYAGFAADVTYAGGEFNQNFNHAPAGTVITLKVPSLPPGKKLVLKNANGTDVDFAYTFENMIISFEMPAKNLSVELVLEDADNSLFTFSFEGVAIDVHNAGETVTFQTPADLTGEYSYTGKLIQTNSDGTFTEISLPDFTFDYDEDSETVSISFTMPFSDVNFILQTTEHLTARPNDPPSPPKPRSPYHTDLGEWFRENYVYFIAACGGLLVIVIMVGISNRRTHKS